METTRENIRQLLEMLDNPEAYTEQEIQDIINRDEDTHETYRLMVEAKRSSRHRQYQKSVDVDAAWQRFNQKLQPKQQGFGWMKIAASFIGVLLVSGIAFAAIHIVRQYQKQEALNTEVNENVISPVTTTPADAIASDTVTVQPVIYDNIPLGKMLPEIAGFYHSVVTFQNEKARQLRLYYEWDQRNSIKEVVEQLNNFEQVSISIKGDSVIVK